NTFITPLLVTVRSVPVISLILLALIWFETGTVPVFIAFLTMFPFICTNVSDGIRNVDRGLLEMARFYRVDKGRILTAVYIPAIMPFIVSGASSAMGIGWRAIIIGEVLSQPEFGIGTKMQTAQTFLNVEAVIAWTLIAVLISFVFEKLIRWGEHNLIRWRTEL
ncbi:MAG: ABC transporter permease subunit, partial [Bacteroidales bacterium]